MYSTIIVEKREGRAKITLNRPEVLNALSPQMLSELGDALEEIAGDDSIGVVVITGAGRAFSAGVDIKGIDETKVESSAAARTKLALRVIDTIEAMDKPVIAEEAREVGLAVRVTSAESLQETVDRLAGKILENSRDSIKAQKHLINKGMKMDLGSGLKMAEKEAPGATPDSEARLRSFKDKA